MDDAKSIYEQFGERVRDLRKARGYTQARLASLCHLDRSYLSDLERGQRNVSLKNIALISKALQVSLSELLIDINIERIDDPPK